MKRLLCAAGLLALVASVGSAGADEKVPSIKEIMTKQNKGPDCLKAQLGKALKADQPDWTAIQKEAKEYATAAEALAKNTPKKGEKDSWEKLCKSFNDNTKSLVSAADKQDLDDAKAALGKVNNSCMGCHSSHRGRP